MWRLGPDSWTCMFWTVGRNGGGGHTLEENMQTPQKDPGSDLGAAEPRAFLLSGNSANHQAVLLMWLVGQKWLKPAPYGPQSFYIIDCKNK